jgi:aspartate/methionine/tyrosine aminotransferase
MVPGPIQVAATLALNDDDHVIAQRSVYRRRLERLIDAFGEIGVKAEMPEGGFYLWLEAPAEFAAEAEPGEGPEWGFTRYLARTAGMLVSPGEFYGPDGAGYVRIAVVQPDDAIDRAARQLVAAPR